MALRARRASPGARASGTARVRCPALGAAVIALALAGCKPRRGALPDDAGPPAPHDAARAIDAAPIDAPPWPALASYPIAAPLRVIGLPARPDVPRFDTGGPVIAGDVAVVSSSQLGFAAIDWRRGALVWTRPAGLHVAPPLVSPQGVILISDCTTPVDVPDTLLGCMRVVTPAGVEQAYGAIHGKKLAAFAAEPGNQDVWLDGDRTVRWRRGNRAVAIDLISGVATAADAAIPSIRVSYRDHQWDIARTPERIVARERGRIAWQTSRPFTALLGAVYLAELAPMVRVASVGVFGGHPEMNLLDIDATGSLHGQAAFPVPAISLLGHGIDAVGNTAIAIRMDSSLRHDFVVGYAANALLMYVYPLPEIPRADPVGVAVGPDAVLVFHDGDTFTVLPELSTPPTAPGAPTRNPTP